MISTQTSLTLLQFIALALPAISIYMQMVYGNLEWEELSPDERDVESGVYSMGRLSILSLLFAGLFLLAFIFFNQFENDWIQLLMTLCANLSLACIGLSILMFSGIVAYERTSRQTAPSIWWGTKEFINHTVGHFTDRSERIFQPSCEGEQSNEE